MNKILKIMFFGVVLSLNFFPVVFAAEGGGDGSGGDIIHGRYENAILSGINSGLLNYLDPMQPNDPNGGGVTVSTFVFNFLSEIIIPLAISVGVVFGIIGAYKLMFSSDEKQISTGLKMVIFGVVGIIIMVSARYIGKVLFVDIFESGLVEGIEGIQLSKTLYDSIVYPFIKIALYLALAVIFVILVGKSISLITNSDGTSHKKAFGIIGWCVIAILIIIGAKSIVEAIYGKQDEVFISYADNLGDIGSGILADKNIPLVYHVITWILSIVGLLIFLLLLVQGFNILIKPAKAENFQKLGKNILYTLIGLFVIGIGYLLTNTLILN